MDESRQNIRGNGPASDGADAEDGGGCCGCFGRGVIESVHSEVIIQGELYCHDPTALFKSWPKKYFVLWQDGFLECYKSQNAFSDGQSADLSMELFGSAIVFIQPPKIPEKLIEKKVIEVNTPKKTLYVYAPNPQDITTWVKHIQDVSLSATERVAQQQAQSYQNEHTPLDKVLRKLSEHDPKDLADDERILAMLPEEQRENLRSKSASKSQFTKYTIE